MLLVLLVLPPSSGVGREEKTAQCSVLPPSTTSSTSSGGREEKTAQVSCRDATARCILFTHHHESPESLRRKMLHHLEPSPTWGFPPSLEGGFGHQCLSTNHAARDFDRSACRL